MLLWLWSIWAIEAMVAQRRSPSCPPVKKFSRSYLEQLFGKPRLRGFVKSVRGPSGEYLLLRKTERIYISDVVSAVEETVQAN